MGQVLLKLTNVTAGYGGVTAVRSVSLTVCKGEVVTLLGPNGAGKTSTLRTISGVLQAKQGQVSFSGRDITRDRADVIARLGLMHVPEGRGIFKSLTVAENLAVAAVGRHVADRKKRSPAVFELFPNLWERRGQQAGSLSGGEQQMLSLGRALMSEPVLIMLDEPSTGLSPTMADRIYTTLSEVNAKGTSLLVVEQNVELALMWSDRSYVMARGRIVGEGSGEELAQSGLVDAAYLGAGNSNGPAVERKER